MPSGLFLDQEAFVETDADFGLHDAGESLDAPADEPVSDLAGSDPHIARYELPDSAQPITESFWDSIDSDEILDNAVAVVYEMIQPNSGEASLRESRLTPKMSEAHEVFWRSIGSSALNDVLRLHDSEPIGLATRPRK